MVSKQEEQAIKLYGFTKNLKDAGYVLPDGRLLNLHKDARVHRHHDEIGKIYGHPNNNADIIRFLGETGAWRINNHSGVRGGPPDYKMLATVEYPVDHSPTKEQWDYIKKVPDIANSLVVGPTGQPNASRYRFYVLNKPNSIMKAVNYIKETTI